MGSFTLILASATCTVKPASHGSALVQEGNSIAFPADETMRMLSVLGRCDRSLTNDITRAWTITDQQRISLDRQLRMEIANQRPATLGVDPRGYYLQFFGVYQGAQRKILVNAFHEILLPEPGSGTQPLGDWTQEPLVVCDGGTGTFQAVYDPDSQRFDSFRFGYRFGPT